MKNKVDKPQKSKIWRVLITILLIPVVAIFLLLLILVTPFDYLKYIRTRYYKDTKEKYSWFCTNSYYIGLYDLIKKENLPIDYYPCKEGSVAGYGYFVCRDTLILNDYEPCYDAEKQTWLVEVEDEYVDMEQHAETVREQCNRQLGSEVCKKTAILMDQDLLKENPEVTYEKIRLIPVSDCWDKDALKQLTSQ